MLKKQPKRRNQSSKNRQSRQRRKRTPKFTNKISDHFSKHDFTCKESGKFKISLGLVGALEELRSKLGQRITIIKGFECPDIAEKKGALKRNFHTQGLAADIQVESTHITDIFKAAETIESINGIGLNIENKYVHVDTRKADRMCWVEMGQEDIELTDANRSNYLES